MSCKLPTSRTPQIPFPTKNFNRDIKTKGCNILLNILIDLVTIGVPHNIIGYSMNYIISVEFGNNQE